MSVLLHTIFVILTFVGYLSQISVSTIRVNNACKLVCKNILNDSYVAEYCDLNDMLMTDRCCINTTGKQHDIIGIDLQQCSLTSLDGLFTNMSQLEVISVEDNPLTNISDSVFNGLLNIKYLSMSGNVSCPGHDDAWSDINRTSLSTICLDEVDYCDHFNVSCPTNSVCVNDGPGSTLCLCASGYYGYKCLRKGTFPDILFMASLFGSTFVVAGILWCTQRRKVKKNV